MNPLNPIFKIGERMVSLGKIARLAARNSIVIAISSFVVHPVDSSVKAPAEVAGSIETVGRFSTTIMTRGQYQAESEIFRQGKFNASAFCGVPVVLNNSSKSSLTHIQSGEFSEFGSAFKSQTPAAFGVTIGDHVAGAFDEDPTRTLEFKLGELALDSDTPDSSKPIVGLPDFNRVLSCHEKLTHKRSNLSTMHLAINYAALRWL